MFLIFRIMDFCFFVRVLGNIFIGILMVDCFGNVCIIMGILLKFIFGVVVLFGDKVRLIVCVVDKFLFIFRLKKLLE